MSVINIGIKELKEMIQSGEAEIIDVREPFEHADHHIKGDKLISMSMVPLKMNEIDWSKKVVVYCRTGARSMMIANMLSGQGKDVYNLAPGIIEWAMNGDEEFIETSE